MQKNIVDPNEEKNLNEKNNIYSVLYVDYLVIQMSDP